MGHWDATTLGNDGAWDCLASFCRDTDTTEICKGIEDGLAPPSSGPHFDEGEAPYVLAVAELVAAGLGRPATTGLVEEVHPWIERNGDLVAAYRDEALAAIDVVAQSPYSTMWVRREGNAEFAASLDDLRQRLTAGRVKKMKGVKARFLDHLARITREHGWKVRKRDATLSRPIEGGCHRVRIRLHGKHGIWSANIRFEVALFEPQRLIYQALDRSDQPDDACVAALRLPREAYHPLGKIWSLRLHQPGVDVPEKAELDAAGLRPADVLNPERTVRLAAERAVHLIETHGEPYFADHGSIEDYRDLAASADVDAIMEVSPPGSRHFWIAIAWAHDPSWGNALIAARKEKLAPFPPEKTAITMKQFDAIERVLTERYGA